MLGVDKEGESRGSEAHLEQEVRLGTQAEVLVDMLGVDLKEEDSYDNYRSRITALLYFQNLLKNK